MTDKLTDKIRYFQCQYCTKHNSGHEVRVPKSIGKYRIQIIYDNILTLKCSRCGHSIKLITNGEIYLWDKMNIKKQNEFRDKYYKGGKENGRKN